MPVLLLAGALLVAGIVGHFIVLPARAPLARAAGIVAIVGVLLWCLAPWQLPVGLAGLIGLEVLALSAWRRGSWPGVAVLVMSLGTVGGPLLLAMAMLGGPIGAFEMPPVYLAAIVALVIPWIAIGGTLLGAVPVRVGTEGA